MHKGTIPQLVGSHQTFIDGYTELSHVTPFYPLLKALGLELPVHPYLFQSVRGRSSIFHYPPNPIPYYDTTDFDLPCNNWKDICRGVVPFGQEHGFGPDVIDAHTVSIGNSLREQASDVDIAVGVALAEAVETLDLISTLVKRFVRSTVALLSGRPRQFIDEFLHGGGSSYARTVAGFGRSAADNWLQWTYGVEPFMADVAGAIEYCQNSYRKRTPFRFRSNAKQEIGGAMLANPNNPGTRRSFRCSGFLKSKGEVRARIVDPSDYKAGRLGLDIPTTLYELVPYSFVVDWFVPVGTWIGTRNPVSGLEFVRGYLTHKGEGTIHRETGVGYGSEKVTSGTFHVYKERQPFSDFPEWRFPSPQWAQSISHCISAAALLLQPFDFGTRKSR